MDVQVRHSVKSRPKNSSFFGHLYAPKTQNLNKSISWKIHSMPWACQSWANAKIFKIIYQLTPQLHYRSASNPPPSILSSNGLAQSPQLTLQHTACSWGWFLTTQYATVHSQIERKPSLAQLWPHLMIVRLICWASLPLFLLQVCKWTGRLAKMLQKRKWHSCNLAIHPSSFVSGRSLYLAGEKREGEQPPLFTQLSIWTSWTLSLLHKERYCDTLILRPLQWADFNLTN